MTAFSKNVLATAFAALCTAGSWAADNAAITLIVPFSAGGSTDMLARVIAKDLGSQLKTSVIVENKPGAEGFIAARQLKAAKSDGTTLMLLTTSIYAINPAIFSDMPYDPRRDFAPVSVVASSPNIILAASSSRYHKLKDVLDAARSTPEAINYGTGATMHLLNAKLLEATSGTRMTSVPYKGSAAAYPDLIAGRVDFMVDQPLSSMTFIQSGQLKALAVTSAQRWPQLPDVPTVAEQGYADFATTSWWAVVAPAGTPLATRQTLHAAIHKGLALPANRDRIRQIGADIGLMSLEESQTYMEQELRQWKSIAQTAKVQPH